MKTYYIKTFGCPAFACQSPFVHYSCTAHGALFGGQATPQVSHAGGQATPQVSHAGGQATPQVSHAGGQADWGIR